MTTYTTSEGDTADLIAWNYYGSTSGKQVERLLEANAGLADYGPLLPAGLVIKLPEAQKNNDVRGVRLWD